MFCRTNILPLDSEISRIMEKELNKELFSTLIFINDVARECKLSEEFFNQYNESLSFIAQQFKVSKFQALIISVVFANTYRETILYFDQLADYLGCSITHLLNYRQEIFDLIFHHILITENSRVLEIGDPMYMEFLDLKMQDKIKRAIFLNKPIPELFKNEFSDGLDFLDHIYHLIKDACALQLTHSKFLEQINKSLEQNSHLIVVQKLNEYPLHDYEKIIYLYTIYSTVLGQSLVDVSNILDALFDKASDKIRYKQNMYSGKNPLITYDLIRMSNQKQTFFFLNDHEVNVELSPNSIKWLHSAEILTNLMPNEVDKLIPPEKITTKQLYLNSSVQQQITNISELLKEENYVKVLQRFKKKGLPAGMNILFYGQPGTGKTETVYQLAKKTNRPIYIVDISSTRSKWYGESEKIIKQIFDEYYDLREKTEICPILLMNEADAILSIRSNLNDTKMNKSIERTENRIQNLLLNELEKFEGILIATTNYIQNIDKAFERRFLFKVHFTLPDMITRTQLWNAFFPYLKNSECQLLSQNYSFSGAQIQNIAQKATMFEILNGHVPELSKIIEFCDEEILSEKTNSIIGFTKK